MNTRTVTRTFVFVALILALSVAGAYARQEHGHVKMTFSGTNVATNDQSAGQYRHRRNACSRQRFARTIYLS